jgi:ribosomal protein L32
MPEECKEIKLTKVSRAALDKQKSRREYRISQGLCKSCGDPRGDDGTSTVCGRCRERRKHYKSKYDKRSLCSKCGVYTDTQLSSTICQNCGDIRPNRTKESYDRRKLSKLCVVCGTLDVLPQYLERATILCEKCYFKRAAHHRLGSTRFWTILQEKMQAQNWLCPYTGEKLVLGVNVELDHILPVSRYPEHRNDVNNVEWVSEKANQMKQSLTKEEFILSIRSIATYLNCNI